MYACPRFWRQAGRSVPGPRACWLLVSAVIWIGGAGHPVAQTAQYAPATLAALQAYPSFFHRMPVVVRALPEGDVRNVFLTDSEHRLRTLYVPPPVGIEETVLDVEGTFWDVGRLQPNDPRVAGHELEALSERLFAKPWPSRGELMLLVADTSDRAEAPGATTIRAIGLEPTRFLGQTVTITGRFRGRNLYGDLPEAPGTSPDDFVLQSGSAAVWIVGKEPKGNGFDLDIMARVDTSRWLQVTGIVEGSDRLVTIAADEVDEVERPTTVTRDIRAPARPEPGPPAEVIFSAPTQDDTAVAIDALIRFQFSRDMNPDSFGERVLGQYVGGDGNELELTVEYRSRNRVLSVQFSEPLEAYRPVTVSLEEGILALDGAPLVPYTLRFATGGG
ncbi:MAG: Ig-like domain-containing protein [Acidobacteriota bacterium]|nr:Ig-like domain-containing protein [Acidobacteriota bacterium]